MTALTTQLEPVLFLHGFPNRSDDWTPLVQSLSDKREFFCPDMIWTTQVHLAAPPQGVGMGLAVEHLLSLITVPRLHLVGHDLGGGVAWWLATLLGERIKTLTILSAPEPRSYLAASAQLEAEGRRDYIKRLLSEPDESPFEAEKFAHLREEGAVVWEAVQKGLQETVPERLRAFYRNSMSGPALSAAANYQSPLCPVLIVNGADDRYFPDRLFDASARQIGPSARRLVMDGAGHFPHLIQAAKLAEALDQFWAASEAPKSFEP